DLEKVGRLERDCASETLDSVLEVRPARIFAIELFCADEAILCFGLKPGGLEHHPQLAPRCARSPVVFDFRNCAADLRGDYRINAGHSDFRQFDAFASEGCNRHCGQKDEPHLPLPFSRMRMRSAGVPGNCSRFPPGHMTSMLSICVRAPNPKCARGSLLQR